MCWVWLCDGEMMGIVKRCITPGSALLLASALLFAQDEAQPEEQPAVPEPPPAEAPAEPAGEPKAPAPDPEEKARKLVTLLGDEKFRVREEATQGLWDLGEIGVAAIKAGEKSGNPEIAHRCRILMRRIMTGITPDTPPDIVELVQRYFRSPAAGKKRVFDALAGKKAYIQMLRIFRYETDPAAKKLCEQAVNEAVLPAIHDLLINGNDEQALELLRLAPPNDANTRRLAALLRVNGTLEQEIARTRDEIPYDDEGKVTAEGMELAAVHLALLRSKGEIGEARTLAKKMGRMDVVATLALAEGDAAPFLTWFMNTWEETPVMRAYCEISLKRWQGDEEGAQKMMENMARLVDQGGGQRQETLHALLLNGYVDLAMPILQKDKERAYLYHETLERPAESIAVYGYQGTDEEKKAWLETRLKSLQEAWEGDEQAKIEILKVASFLQVRGLSEHGREMILKLSAIPQEKGEKAWLKFLSGLRDLPPSVFELGFVAAVESLKEVEVENEALKTVHALFGEGDQGEGLWELFAGVEENFSKRLELLGAAMGYTHIDEELLTKSLLAARKIAEKHDGTRLRKLNNLFVAAESRNDVEEALALVEMLGTHSESVVWQHHLARYYSYLGEWDKASERANAVLKDVPNDLRFLGLLGGVHMKQGKTDEAQESITKVERIAMDEAERLWNLATDLSRSGALEESSQIYTRLANTNTIRNWYWHAASYYRMKDAMKKKQWRVAAAYAEVHALQFMLGRRPYKNPVTYLRKRYSVDFCLGMARVTEGDREGGLALLKRAFEMIEGDGLLADDFFPYLREAGLTEEHDRYFDLVYKRLEDSIKIYPNAHNTYNTAAWMASRSMRKLDDAHAKATKAIEMRPRQAAYLDTMAEVWFAKGDREKAVAWSVKAVAKSYHGGFTSEPDGVEAGLLEQLDRFRSGNFPAP